MPRSNADPYSAWLPQGLRPSLDSELLAVELLLLSPLAGAGGWTAGSRGGQACGTHWWGGTCPLQEAQREVLQHSQIMFGICQQSSSLGCPHPTPHLLSVHKGWDRPGGGVQAGRGAGGTGCFLCLQMLRLVSSSAWVQTNQSHFPRPHRRDSSRQKSCWGGGMRDLARELGEHREARGAMVWG